jgi:toxin ParE1/3/4
MAGFALSPAAQADLDDAWHYIALESGEGRADAYLDRIYEVFDLLAHQPHAGRARPELLTDLRSFPAAGHVVYYRPSDNCIDVMRVLHGSRDMHGYF